MFSPVYHIKSADFLKAWEKLVDLCLRNGVVINFGGREEEKIAKEIVAMVTLEGKAIEQILNAELPEGVHFREKAVEAYREEYTYDFVRKQEELPENSKEKHPYTYMGRFVLPVDQVEIAKQGIKTQQETMILSNRIQMITWDTEKDSFKSASPPCLQRIWIRWDPETNQLEIHLNWRSRDLFDAWTSNLIGLIWMINEYIAKPLGLTIGRVIDISDSLHVYKHRW